jgi:integrative and conjugative element protein (TIGR02256 family)
VLDVVHAGDAGPRAIREAAFFRRDVAHAQALADLAYRTDGSIWLGEWHTHPDRLSRPSQLDLTSYRQMLNDPALAFTFFLAMIVLPGPSGGWHRPRLTGWVVSTADIWPALLRSRIHAGGFTK